MKKKSLIFAKAAIISLAFMLNFCSSAFGQCLSSFFVPNPDRYVVSASHTVSSDCTIDHNVVVLSGCTLSFIDPNQDPIEITFTDGISITVNSGGTISGTNTTFKGTQQGDTWGGIRITGGTHSFTDCEFYDAEKTGNNSCQEDHAGGAIWVFNGSIVLTRCTISGCNTEDAGGAICLRNASIGSFTDCVFSYNNTANPSVGGGAIALLSHSELTINNGIFVNNSSSTLGGAILVRSSPSGTATSELEIYNSTFNGNIANNGGAIAITRSDVEIDNTFFNENVATYGGAIYSSTDIDLISSDCSFSLVRCEFNSNTSEFKGGAIFIEANTSNHEAEIIESTFNENRSDEAGGAIYSVADNGGISLLTIEQDCDFYKNESHNGGAIANIRSDFTINQTTFRENSANFGGAIFCSSGSGAVAANSNVELSECSLTNNTATNGGAIYSESSTFDYPQDPFHISTVKISSNSEFSGNSAVYKGGAISLLRAKADISETSFIGNFTNDEEDAGGFGGAFYSSKNRGEIKIVDCNFEDNNSDIGGAIAIQSSIWDYPHENRYNNISIEKSTFKLNSTTAINGTKGGAIYLGDYPQWCPNLRESLDGLIIRRNKFEENSSYSGGALCLNNLDGGATSSLFTITENFFEENTASMHGGAIAISAMDYGDINLFLNKITSNSANRHGGGVYLSNVLDFNCINNLIADNQTIGNGHGGGVYTINSDNLAFGSNTIANNIVNSGDGGGIYFTNSNSNSPYPIVFNSILWGNNPSSIYDANHSSYWDYCDYSDIEGISGQGNSNIDVDPEFTDPSNGDYTLDCDASPCVNAGDNSFFHTDYDLAGVDRILEACIDMGAYECQPSGARRMKSEMLADDVSVFPNPFSDELSIKSRLPIETLRLYSATGQLVYSDNSINTDLSLPLNNLPAGVYILQIETVSETHIKRVVKTKDY